MNVRPVGGRDVPRGRTDGRMDRQRDSRIWRN